MPGPKLKASPVAGELGPAGAGVHQLGQDGTARLGRYVQAGGPLQALLNVTVAQAGAPADESVPHVSGAYRLTEDGIWFEPHFPFEAGLPYRASFDPRPLGDPELTGVLILEFSRSAEHGGRAPSVERIFPGGDVLPENLLRFYVCFSAPMQRGRAGTQITLLGPDDEPVPDVLYRAPVELWDRGMRCLTILLDPGRLKRGVGPNRELGPPLKAGQAYTLAVGSGMTDLSGVRLGRTVHKRFQIADPVRKPVDIGRWKVVAPSTDSRQPLTLIFPGPLDWALLSSTITVASPLGQPVAGHIEIGRCETRWSFVPNLPWSAGPYQVHVAPGLEDVCGNDRAAPFDRTIRPGGDLAGVAAPGAILFEPECRGPVAEPFIRVPNVLVGPADAVGDGVADDTA